MTESIVGLGREGLHRLRAALERILGPAAAPVLQDVGFAAGDGIATAFEAWVRTRYRVPDAGALEARLLGEALTRFFEEQGWGVLRLTRLGDGLLAVDAPAWAEAEPGTRPAPTCHVSAGMFAELFSRLAGAPFAAMEVECRSRGDGRCRFLLGAPAALTVIYERMTRGEDGVDTSPER